VLQIQSIRKYQESGSFLSIFQVKATTLCNCSNNAISAVIIVLR